MFKPEDFEIGLEQQLRLRVIKDEIDQCDDRDALKHNLKNCTELIMKYQQMLNRLLREQITKNLAEFTEIAKKLGETNS